MPVKLKITLLFTAIVFLILGFVCSAVYYFSVTSRRDYIETRLTNLAVTTGRFLTRAETFSPLLIQKIDSLTAIAFTHKTVLAYDRHNNRLYSFYDDDADEDRLTVSNQMLDEVRRRGRVYTTDSERDVVYYHFVSGSNDLVIVASGHDIFGKENIRSLLIILLATFLFGLCIALVSGYIFSGRLLGPISRIADEVNDISAHNLTRRIETGTTRDEWFYLSDTLNNLLNRLHDSFETQQRFISNASHELSTPLTAISSQLEITLQRERDASEYRRVMNSVYQDVRHMSKLTQTLLEFAKASGNPAGLELSILRIDEILLKIPAEIARANRKYAVNLLFDELPQEEENLLVYGNETLLLTSISNIVLNACKYSENHRAVVRLKASPGNIFIMVEDNGPGISNEELRKIFQPFYRVEENRNAGGFGLGLSLAKRIIQLHKGSLSVRSEKGKGSVFTIRFPVIS